MGSRKRFNEAAKRLKRKKFITAADARDQLARENGFTDFAAMERVMVETGQWR